MFYTNIFMLWLTNMNMNNAYMYTFAGTAISGLYCVVDVVCAYYACGIHAIRPVT